MKHIIQLALLASCVLVLFQFVGFAQPPDEETAMVTSQAMAVLKNHCHSCHGAEKHKGSLRLDGPPTKASIVIAKDPEKSELFKRVTHTGEERMPPDKPLTVVEIEVLKRWIAAGAHWPDTAKGNSPAKKLPWSFTTITKPTPPTVRNQVWVLQSIDSFILAKIERAHLTPSPEADRATLIRRLSLDLLGLLPTPEEVDAFLADTNPKAYEKLVEKTLSSPHFGEKWGRHWLDLARYADSDGYEHDEPRPDAYHFRDWVIRAFNADMPFDQFTREQLAGDLLPNPSEEQLIASGFHRQTMKHNTSEMINEDFRIKSVKDRVNTTGTVWLGLTIGCAECHNHKFDPITQTDYYRLYSLFNDANERDQTGKDGKKLVTFETKQKEAFIHLRGNPSTPGEKVEPGFPEKLPAAETTDERLNRLHLAEWLMSAEHPLTARVEVNRIWKQLFGTGLVTSADDFGNRGQAATHPELLDWLASELRSNGWSRKKLIQQIVKSSTYRQSSRIRPEQSKADPTNALYTRQNRFRLDAENIYDISYQVAGLLRLDTVGGPSFQPPFPAQLDTKVIKNNRLMETSSPVYRYRRGLYIQVQRTYQHPFLNGFDTPDASQCCAIRDRSQTPAQALARLNDPIFQECADKLRERMEEAETMELGIRNGFKWCIGRPPTREEEQILIQLYQRQERSNSGSPWLGVATVLLNMEAFTTRE